MSELWFSTRVSWLAAACAVPFIVMCVLHFGAGTGSAMQGVLAAAIAVVCGVPAALIARSAAKQANDCRAKVNAICDSRLVIEYDLDGKITGGNDIWVKSVGCSSVDQLIGRHHSSFVDSTYASSPAYAEFWRRLRSGERIEQRGKRIGSDGKEIWIIANYTPLIGPSGKPYAVVNWSTNYTEAHREQAVVVDALAAGLQKVANGDLTAKIETHFGEEYEDLRTNFNATLRRLHETITAVLSTANSISNGASEISQAADDLSHRTEQQAASLEETAAALEEITASVKKSAANAGQTSVTVNHAKVVATEGGEIVDRAVKAMDSIAQSSKQITDIIGVIDEIAFQTNLLALNAGVEAARAGEAGKGFAVVASEVRGLAQRSGEAAKQIKTLIKASGEYVDDGVKFVAESGAALKRILDEVTKINDLARDSVTAGEQQASGIEQVNVAVGQMDQVTQQNAAMVEQSTAASRNLANETKSLSDLVAFFTVGDAAKPATIVSPAKAAPARPQPRRAATGGSKIAAVAVQQTSQSAPENDWTEF